MVSDAPFSCDVPRLWQKARDSHAQEVYQIENKIASADIQHVKFWHINRDFAASSGTYRGKYPQDARS